MSTPYSGCYYLQPAQDLKIGEYILASGSIARVIANNPVQYDSQLDVYDIVKGKLLAVTIRKNARVPALKLKVYKYLVNNLFSDDSISLSATGDSSSTNKVMDLPTDDNPQLADLIKNKWKNKSDG
jgi:hypothetical protein